MARKWRLQPARFPEIREQERALWDAVSAAFDRFCEYVWRFCPVPGEWAGLAVPGPPSSMPWPIEDQAEFDRAVRWFVDSMMGKGRDAEAFSDPSNAAIDVRNPIYDGKPILPGRLRTSFEVGINRAVQIVGADAPALLGQRNIEGQRTFLRTAFARLSDGARIKLADVLNGDPTSGESVRQMLLRSLAEGQAPLKTARDLKAKFREIDGYNWQRLARTETSLAQNTGLRLEYQARGYVVPTDAAGMGIELPSYHPQCCCSTTVLPSSGLIVPDVAATACEKCQAALARALTITSGSRVAPREPLGPAPQPWSRIVNRRTMPPGAFARPPSQSTRVRVPRSVAGPKDLDTPWHVPPRSTWPKWIDRDDPWIASLTDAEAHAVRRWVRSMDDVDAIRWTVRNPENVAKASLDMRTMADAFRGAVLKQRQERGTFYRGEHDIGEKLLDQLVPGNQASFATFASSTLDPGVALDSFAMRGSKRGVSVLWELEDATGRNIEPLVFRKYAHQRERILDEKQRFAILDRTEEVYNGRRLVRIKARRVSGDAT